MSFELKTYKKILFWRIYKKNFIILENAIFFCFNQLKQAPGKNPYSGVKSTLSASGKAYRTRRSAMRTITRIGSTDPALLLEDEKGRLDWDKAHQNDRPPPLRLRQRRPQRGKNLPS